VYTASVLADFLLLLLSLSVLAVFATMFVHVFVLRVPYVPTSMDVVRTMVDMAALQDGQTVYDLGAGDGRILCEAVARRRGLRATGVEYVPTIWLLGWLRTRFARGAIRFRLGDALKQKLGDADVIFVYMMPHFLARLSRTFDLQLRPGTVVVSHSFRFPDREPREQTVVKRRFSTHTVYRYVW
jgi:precorrin-6B methylase 2